MLSREERYPVLTTAGYYDRCGEQGVQEEMLQVSQGELQNRRFVARRFTGCRDATEMWRTYWRAAPARQMSFVRESGVP